MIKQNIRTGSLLLAEPFMADLYFKRAAILLTEHRNDGTMGFILNKQLENVRLNDLIGNFVDNFDVPVYYGGPVGTDSIYFLHDKGNLLQKSHKVCKNVYWGGDFDQLRFLIEQELITHHDIRFFVGYSGWEEGQLDTELQEGSWILGDMDSNYLFKTPFENLWQTALTHKGDTFSVIANIHDEGLNN